MSDNGISKDLKEEKTDRTIKKNYSFFPFVIIIAIVVILTLVSYAFLLATGNADLFNQLRENSIEYILSNTNLLGLEQIIAFFIFLALSMVVLLALFAEYEVNKDVRTIRRFNNMFVEVKYIIIPALLTLFYWLGLHLAFQAFFSNTMYFELSIIKPYDSIMYFIMGLSVGIPILLYIFLAVFSLKAIIIEGIFWHFFHKTILGVIILKIVAFLKGYLDKNTILCLSKYRNIMFLSGYFILFVSFIIFPASILYIASSAVLLYLLDNLTRKVAYLEIKAQSISNGNYDTIIDSDLGCMTNLAKSLSNISTGFKSAVEKEIKSQKSKTELITNVSHDLKTPLTSIINYSDLILKSNTTTEEKLEYTKIVHDKSIRLKALIEDLFEISKTASGDIELNLEKIDIVELFYQALGEMENKLQEKELNVIAVMSEDKTYSLLDGRRTFRIFENIISNISKYSLFGTRVYINSEIVDESKFLQFTFKNISNYEMNFNSSELYDRFFRGDKSRNTEGSGLGLGIAKNLIELQGGSLEVIIDGDLFKLIAKFPITLSH